MQPFMSSVSAVPVGPDHYLDVAASFAVTVTHLCTVHAYRKWVT